MGISGNLAEIYGQRHGLNQSAVRSGEKAGKIANINSAPEPNPYSRANLTSSPASTPAATFDPSPEGLRRSLFADLGIDSDSSSISLDSLAKGRDKAQEVTQERLAEKLKALGISSSTKVDMKVGYNGRILVTNEFEGSEKLEDSLNEDRKFSNTFRAWSAVSSLLNAAAEAEEFQKAYAQDPEAAVSEFMHLFNQSRKNEFSATFEGGKLNYAFQEKYDFS
jgi:hypothetical protein